MPYGSLMSTTPTSSWAWVKALPHPVYAQFDCIADALGVKLPCAEKHPKNLRDDILIHQVNGLERSGEP